MLTVFIVLLFLGPISALSPHIPGSKGSHCIKAFHCRTTRIPPLPVRMAKVFSRRDPVAHELF
ncbi:MAG: hypothetical protein AMXMBFR4_04650 [Candidatus Hydrogenedentota bacterium]